MNKKYRTKNLENEQGRECGICERIMPIKKNVIDGGIRTAVLLDSSWDKTINYNGEEVVMRLFCCDTCTSNLSNKVIGPNRQDLNQYIDAIVFFNEQKRKIKRQIKAEVRNAFREDQGFKPLRSGDIISSVRMEKKTPFAKKYC